MMSGGHGSWMTARLAREQYGLDGMVLLFTDVNGEDPDLYRFLREAVEDIGAEHVYLDNDGRTVWDVFRKERMIGNTRLSVCSRALKQVPARKWLDANADPATTVVITGIDWTEPERLGTIRSAHAHPLSGCDKGICHSLWNERGERLAGPGCRKLLPPEQQWRVEAPLINRPDIDDEFIDKALADAGIAPAALYAHGFPHNNCGGACVRGGQAQWALLLKVNPTRYAEEERQEQEFPDLVGKDVAILRDRRGGTTQPLTLTALRERVQATPEQIDMLDFGGCGCVA